MGSTTMGRTTRRQTGRAVTTGIAMVAALLTLLTEPASAIEQIYGVKWLQGRVYRTDIKTGVGTEVYQHGLPVNAMATDRQAWLHFVDDDDAWHQFDPVSGTVELLRDLTSELQGRSVRGMAFGPDARMYFTLNTNIATDHDLAVWDDATDDLIVIGRDGRSTQSLAFAPDGTLYAYSLTEGLGTYDRTTGAFTPTGGPNQLDIQTIEFSPFGALLAANDDLFALDPATGEVIDEAGPLVCPGLCDFRGMAILFDEVGCCLPTGCEMRDSGPLCDMDGGVYSGSDNCDTCSGACCFDDGACTTMSPFACTGMGGVYTGSGTVCAVVECLGACCFDDTTCTETIESGCAAAGGAFFGRGSTCATAGCTGACCFDDDVCSEQRPLVCAAMGGTYMGDDVVCASSLCRGSCCLNGSCLVHLTPGVCAAVSGTFNGYQSDCVSSRCGACCLTDGSCIDTSAQDCDLVFNNGVFLDGERCSDDACATAPGQCCLPDDRCVRVPEAACRADDGLWLGIFAFCNIPCPDECIADIVNDDDLVNFDDLALLLAEWGPCFTGCQSDIVPNEFVDFDDLALVLALWGPCAP